MELDRKDLPILFRMGMSALVLILCFYILLNQGFPADYTKWAFGMIGVIIGYWLK